MAFARGINRRQVMTGAVGVGAASALGIAIARAQTATPGVTPATPAAGTTVTGGSGKKLYDDFITRLAANLGNLDTAKVDSAVRTSLKQMVDEAQQAGLIGANEASTLKTRIDSSNFPADLAGELRGRFGGRGHVGRGQVKPKGRGGLAALGGFDLEALAQFLGITRADLVKELADGKSLAEIAQEHGKSRDDLKAYLVSQATDEIDTLIDATRGSKNGQAPAGTPAATPATT